MKPSKVNHSESLVVLIVDDVMDNLALLHDALDESGFVVLVANNGQSAIDTATSTLPDIILLDAIMPEMDGFEVCAKLKAHADTSQIPVIFMTGLTETEHVVKAFQVGGTDYITKPIRIQEVLARIEAHLHNSHMVKQARVALDAFGQAAIAVTPESGHIVWQTPLARQLMKKYFEQTYSELSIGAPAQLMSWIHAIQTKLTQEISEAIMPLVMIKTGGRLSLSLANASEEQWVILLREESDAQQIDALMSLFKLTIREAEVLYWVTKGKTSRDIGDILGSSPRTVNKHLEHIYVKLGVETRTAAAALVSTKLRLLKMN
jgi:DNA-binding response OmpR family regulator/DNA-binding CsgD family transcriptional regulator